MIKIVAGQQHAVDTISAHAFFTGKTVLKDLGKSYEIAEQKLNTDGIITSVLPLLEGDTESVGGVRAVINCVIPVWTRVDVERVDIYAAMTAVFEALLGWTDAQKNPNDKYTLDGKAFVMDDLDPGILAVTQFFKRRCVF